MKNLISSRFMKEEFPFYILRVMHGYLNTPDMHGHDFVELIYVVSGQGQHRFDGEEYEIRSGDVFIVNPGEVHTYDFEPGQQIEIINCLFQPVLIRDTLLRELEISQTMDYFYVHPFLNKKERFNHRLNLQGQSALTVLSLLESMIREQNERPPGFATLIRLQMVELLILLSRYYAYREKEHVTKRSGETMMMALRIKGFLERNYDQKITLELLSETFNISQRQLNRLIKNLTDMTIFDLLHHIRIEKAKYFLTSSDDKIINIATAVGYEDPAFFSRLFARTVGCSPGKYRDHKYG
jgi:AraC-like DNA-binding protein